MRTRAERQAQPQEHDQATIKADNTSESMSAEHVAPQHGQFSPNSVLQMQRSHGNAFVQRQLANVQREVTIDEMTTSVDDTGMDPAAANGGGGGGGAPAGQQTTLGDGSASVTAEGGKVTINAGSVDVNAAMTNNTGTERVGTLLADSVIASSYSPGAGNVW